MIITLRIIILLILYWVLGYQIELINDYVIYRTDIDYIIIVHIWITTITSLIVWYMSADLFYDIVTTPKKID